MIHRLYYCSFCHVVSNKVDHMISGPDRVNICDVCVDLCTEVLAEKRAAAGEDPVKEVE